MLSDTAMQARRHSVQVMLRHQHESGSFPASPDFSQYGYCWLRDGAFIAHALDRAGEFESVTRYHGWCIRAIERVLPRMTAALDRHQHGKPLDARDVPPARFSLAGDPVRDDWPNFQIDGYGTWLWALGRHVASQGRPLPAGWTKTVHRTAEYLAAFVLEPCYDVWEENGDEVHTSTVGSAAAGIESALSLLRDGTTSGIGLGRLDDALADAREQIATAGRIGWYAKSNLRPGVDASALWLSAPLEVVPADDAVMARTVAQAERQLVFEGGVRRYLEDSYFGGGAWPVLTCSLGLQYARLGRWEDARSCLGWTVSRVDAVGRLGEQFGGERRSPESYRSWVRRWGQPARDLLWSHAMLVLLATELDDASAVQPG